MRGGVVTRLINKIQEIYNDDRGNYLVLSTVVFLVLIILTVGMVEFGRVILFRNQLQTAGDAAALAAAGADEDVTKWVRITVTTDRGNQEHCSSDGDCDCSSCGSASITVVGLEEDLLDNGSWQDFCLPPCDCGGDSCTIEIIDRWVTMTTTTATTGGNQQDITRAINSIVSSTKESISYKGYPCESEVAQVLRNANDLGTIREYVTNSQKFMNRWEDYNCERLPIGREPTWEEIEKHNACMSRGHYAWQRIQSSTGLINRMQNSVNKLNTLGDKQTTAGVSKEYVGEVVHDYLIANLPGAWPTNVEIYDQRSSRFYPSVVVYAMTDIEVLMKDFVSIPLLLDPSADYMWGNDDTVASVETCSQGNVHYIDPSLTNYSDQGALNAAVEDRYYVSRPDDACQQ